MNFKTILISYALTFIVFLIVDLAWLGFIAKNIYNKYLGGFLTDSVNWTAAIIFYLIFVAGLTIFVIYPSLEKESLWRVIILGALFGIITYATYDLTNLATLKDWPLPIVIIDIAWGAILSTIVSLAGYTIFKYVSALIDKSVIAFISKLTKDNIGLFIHKRKESSVVLNAFLPKYFQPLVSHHKGF